MTGTTNRGAEKLTAWLRAHGMNDETFAEKVDTHQTSVSNWCRGRFVPRGGMMAAIQKVTGIKPADWDAKVAAPSTRDREREERKAKKRKAA